MLQSKDVINTISTFLYKRVFCNGFSLISSVLWIAFICSQWNHASVYLDYLPYESLRPHQDRMLDAVYDVVSRGKQGILMIDAPRHWKQLDQRCSGRRSGKIVVAVRTVSQIDIYIDEIIEFGPRPAQAGDRLNREGKQRIAHWRPSSEQRAVYAAA